MAKHYGWGDHKKICGPFLMCGRCAIHPAGHPSHKTPQVAGKPFIKAEQKDMLVSKGFTVGKKELAALKAQGKPPPGQPKLVGPQHARVKVYSPMHFG